MHPLDGPRLKVKRAVEHLDALHQSAETFLKSPFYEVRPDAEMYGTDHYWRFYFRERPPLMWSILVGELLYEARSALDQLIWQLWTVNGRTPNVNSQFPIFHTGPLKRSYIAGLSDSHQAIIESLQPYVGHGGKTSTLWILHELNNLDKHRTIPLTVATAHTTEVRWEQSGGLVMGLGSAISGPLEDGVPVLSTKLLRDGEIGSEVTMKLDLSFNIEFGRGPDIPPRVRLFPALPDILDDVHGIIEMFAPDFPQ